MKDNQYKKEAERKWGHTKAYKESTKKIAQYTKQDWSKIQEEAADIYASFFALKGADLSSKNAEEAVLRWQKHISEHYYQCSNTILERLGRMYIADERFRRNIDQNGEGIAAIMSEAIEAYCAKRQ